MTISGEMPKWRRVVHRCASGFMFLFFAVFAVYGARLFFMGSVAGRGKGPAVAMMLWFTFLAAFAIGMQRWYDRRMIAQFSFDGSLLRFTTLGNEETQARDLSEIVQVREWRGRGGPLGYRLDFRDGAKAYLQYSVTNATALGEQLRFRVGLS